jgi:hypothetical protein
VALASNEELFDLQCVRSLYVQIKIETKRTVSMAALKSFASDAGLTFSLIQPKLSHGMSIS